MEPNQFLPISDTNEVRVRNWFLEPISTRDVTATWSGKVRIWGRRPEEPKDSRWWRTSCIVRRLTSKSVVTYYGTRVTLLGQMHALYAGKFHLSKETLAAFQNGIPIDWYQRIVNEQHVFFRNITTSALLGARELSYVSSTSAPNGVRKYLNKSPDRPQHNDGPQDVSAPSVCGASRTVRFDLGERRTATLGPRPSITKPKNLTSMRTTTNSARASTVKESVPRASKRKVPTRTVRKQARQVPAGKGVRRNKVRATQTRVVSSRQSPKIPEIKAKSERITRSMTGSISKQQYRRKQKSAVENDSVIVDINAETKNNFDSNPPISAVTNADVDRELDGDIDFVPDAPTPPYNSAPTEMTPVAKRPRKRVAFAPVTNVNAVNTAKSRAFRGKTISDTITASIADVTDNLWTDAQKEAFERQRNTVAANVSDYWEQVAGGVIGKSAAECRALWQANWTSPVVKINHKRKFYGAGNRLSTESNSADSIASPETKSATPEVVMHVRKASRSKRSRDTAKYRSNVRRLAEVVARDTSDDALEPRIVTPNLVPAATAILTKAARLGQKRGQDTDGEDDGTPGTEVRLRRAEAERQGELATPEILARGKKVGFKESDQYVTLFKKRIGSAAICAPQLKMDAADKKTDPSLHERRKTVGFRLCDTDGESEAEKASDDDGDTEE